MYSLPSVIINRKTQGDPVKLIAVGKLLERFWQDCGKTMADCQDNLSDSDKEEVR